MCDDVRDAEQIGPMQFFHESIDRLPPQRLVGRGQIYQVGVVGNRVRNLVSGQGFAELLYLVRCDFLRPPLVIVLGEQLDAVTPALGGP
jgi:hypothetical protein